MSEDFENPVAECGLKEKTQVETLSFERHEVEFLDKWFSMLKYVNTSGHDPR